MEEVKAAFQEVLNDCPNGFAKAYAKAGLGLTEREDVRVQILYVLDNTSSWRGEQARRVKNVLRQNLEALK